MVRAELAFRQECATQLVQVVAPIENALMGTLVLDGRSVGYRTGVLASVIAAASRLEESPGAALADKPIDPSRLANDVPSKVLVGLINASLGIKQESTPHFSIKEPAGELDDCCAGYEEKWVRTFESLRKKRDAKPLVQIFTDEGNEPVLMRKGRGRPTGLLLVDAALGKNGIVYPAGSAVQISTPQDAYYGGTAVYDRKLLVGGEQDPEIVSISAIDQMSFLRMTPFQVPIKQRARHFDKRLGSYPMIGDIRNIAHEIVRQGEPRSSGAALSLARIKQRMEGFLSSF